MLPLFSSYFVYHTHKYFSQHTVLTAVRNTNIVVLCRGCTNIGSQVARATEFCSVLVLTIELFHITLLEPRILSLLLDFWKICEHVFMYILFTVSGRNDGELWPCVNRYFLFERPSVQISAKIGISWLKRSMFFFSRGRKCNFLAWHLTPTIFCNILSVLSPVI
jgi:hypothetical protein